MDLIRLIEENAFSYGVKIVTAIIVLFIGFQIINFLINAIEKGLVKTNVDKTLRPFIKSILSIALKIMLLLAVAGTLGITTTSFVAVLASVGLAIGLALQGSVSNFAGGIIILLFKPFEVDDYIAAQGVEGNVSAISLFFTTLIKLNGETVFLPNGALANNTITNFTKQGKIRLQIPVGVAYNSDLLQVRKIMEQVMEDNHLVLRSPQHDVIVSELGNNSINLLVRPWVCPEHKPAVTAQLLEAIKLKLDENKIEIPFPQTVIHVKK